MSQEVLPLKHSLRDGSIKGFTLIEALIVVGIIGVTVAIGTDLLTSVIKTSNKATVVNQLKQNVTSTVDEIERAVRIGYGIAPAELALPSNRSFITILNADRSAALRYRICQRHFTEDRCLSTADVEGVSESCPTGKNCVGHMRKYSCTRTANTGNYDCATSVGVLTNIDRVSGTDLVTIADVPDGGAKYSRFTVYTGGQGVTVTLTLFALQGPDAPSRSDFRVCEATDIATCQGLVELTTTAVMRQR